MKRFFAAAATLLAAVALVAFRWATPHDILHATATLAGDSVVVMMQYADAANVVSVDTVEFAVDLNGAFGSARTAHVAKVAGSVTTGRIAYALSEWGSGQTKGSAVKVRLAHVGSDPGVCTAGVCWSAQTTGPNWSYTRDATAPNAPAAADITVQSVGLN